MILTNHNQIIKCLRNFNATAVISICFNITQKYQQIVRGSKDSKREQKATDLSDKLVLHDPCYLCC